MHSKDYNYSIWRPGTESFEDFATEAPQVTSRAPSFIVEDLSTGRNIEMKDLWRKGITVVEFGSFT